tara:strand:+ start:313 stop:942 length:630 start_codon:yes stop_codon:yes gene_type:complete
MGIFDFFKKRPDENTLNLGSINDAFLYANKLQNDGDHDKAINVYTIVLNLIFKNDSENTVEGSNFIEKNPLVKSDNPKETTVHIIPIEGVYFNLGSSYFQLKMLDKAKEAFEQAIKVNNDCEAFVHHHLGCTKFYLGDFTTCIRDFDNALKKDKDHFDSYYMRAVAYCDDRCEIKNYKKGILDLNKYLKYEPEDKAGNKLLNFLQTKGL